MSRKVRLSFAAPLVLIAAVPACVVRPSSQPPAGETAHSNPPPTAEVHDDDDAPGHVNPPGPHVNPPRQPPPPMPGRPPMVPRTDPNPGTATQTPTQQPPQNLRAWSVFQNKNDKACYAQVAVDCPPKPATCNPPPPRKLASCPTSITMDGPVRVVETAPDTCLVTYAAPACPPNMACNPPRPEEIDCPQ